MDSFETERLKARKLTADDFEILYKFYINEDVCRTLGGVKTADWVKNYIAKNIEHWELFGYGTWIFYSKSGNKFAGRGAIRHLYIDGKDEIEVGYAFLPEYWGKGYATEIVKEIVNIAFNVYQLTEIIAVTLHDNLASRRVMEKAGLSYEKEVIHADLPHVLYRLKQENYNIYSL
ncbi:MAG TPA: GNAT family N-acetyltransferase [Ignavibacteria bacterium]|nr:GNAT family N-acetyltransferase [Ignavibacteria bacterium]